MAGGPDRPKESSAERALGRIGGEKFARFMERIAPLEREFIADVSDQREERSRQRGLASNELANISSQRRQQAGLTASQSGNALKLAEPALEAGQSAGLAQAGLEGELDKQYVQDVQGLVARGSGQSGRALSGLNSAAQAASSRAIEDARASLANRQAKQQAATTLLGLGASGIQSDTFKNVAGQVTAPVISRMAGGPPSPTGASTSANTGAGLQQFPGLTTYPY